MAERKLIRLEDMLSILDKEEFNESETNLINQQLIPNVSAAVERFCKRNILDSAALTEYYNGDGTNLLILDQCPVNSITSIKDRQDNPTSYGSDAYDNTLTADEDYIIYDAKAGMLMNPTGSWISSPPYYYQVVYRAGWVISEIPHDIRLAVQSWVAILFQKTTSGVHGVDTHIFGDESLTYDNNAIPKAVKNLLVPYIKRDFV